MANSRISQLQYELNALYPQIDQITSRMERARNVAEVRKQQLHQLDQERDILEQKIAQMKKWIKDAEDGYYALVEERKPLLEKHKRLQSEYTRARQGRDQHGY